MIIFIVIALLFIAVTASAANNRRSAEAFERLAPPAEKRRPNGFEMILGAFFFLVALALFAVAAILTAAVFSH